MWRLAKLLMAHRLFRSILILAELLFSEKILLQIGELFRNRNKKNARLLSPRSRASGNVTVLNPSGERDTTGETVTLFLEAA